METEVKWRRWLGCYFQWGLCTCGTQTCFWKQTGGVAHVCKGFTHTCKFYVEGSYGMKNNTCKTTSSVAKSVRRKITIGANFSLTSSLIFIFFSEKRQLERRTIRLNLKQLGVKRSGAAGRLFFRPDLLFLMSSPALQQLDTSPDALFLDTSACSGSWCADSSLGAPPLFLDQTFLTTFYSMYTLSGLVL